MILMYLDFIPGKIVLNDFDLDNIKKKSILLYWVISCEITHHSFVLFLKIFPRLRLQQAGRADGCVLDHDGLRGFGSGDFSSACHQP